MTPEFIHAITLVSRSFIDNNPQEGKFFIPDQMAPVDTLSGEITQSLVDAGFTYDSEHKGWFADMTTIVE